MALHPWAGALPPSPESLHLAWQGWYILLHPVDSSDRAQRQSLRATVERGNFFRTQGLQVNNDGTTLPPLHTCAPAPRFHGLQ